MELLVSPEEWWMKGKLPRLPVPENVVKRLVCPHQVRLRGHDIKMTAVLFLSLVLRLHHHT